MAMKLLHGINIITMDANTSVLMDGALVVLNDKIHALGSKHQIMEEYAKQADELLDLSGRWIIPGLINTHVHTSQQLGRGIADDVDLLTWLHKRIWPYESNMTEEDSYISTLLCGLELIHSGVTCFAEAGGQHVVSMVQAVEQLGIRACLTRSTMDSGEGLPSSWAAETADYCLKVGKLMLFRERPASLFFTVQVQEKLFKEHNNKAEGRIRIWFGLRQILNATDKLLLLTREAAERYKTGIHMHVAEIAYENQWVSSTRGVDHGTVTFLDKIGLLGGNLLAAHSVWLNDDEVNLYARHGVKVSHCPAAAMRMLGFAPIQEMLNAGICVGIGTDGAPSNNRMSIVDEMYLASLINKGRASFLKGATDPTLLPVETVLRMATINGAKAVLWDNDIGSLEVGKKADLVVINPQRWSMVPLHDPIGSLVSSMRTENIESVMCNGKWIMKDQKVLTVDEEFILRKAQQLGEGVVLRAGIKLPRRMVVC